jgi:hypothetical protein
LAVTLAPALVRADAGGPDKLRQKVFTWLDRNYNSNKYPDTAAQVRKWIDQALRDGDDWDFTFGPGVMVTGKPYHICVFAGRLHRFRLSPKQVRKLVSGPDRVAATSAKRRYQVEPARIKLAKVRIDGAAHFNPRNKITGTVSFKLRENLPEKAALRLTCRHGKTTSQHFFYFNALTQTAGSLPFSFSAFQGEKDKESEKITGPVVVYVDVCTLKQQDREPYLETKVFSNSVAALLKVGPPPAANGLVPLTDRPMPLPMPTAQRASAPTGLVGTKWKFLGTQTTIEFLRDGKFRWNGAAATGHWTKVGTSVVINLNDFTLFELTRSGDKMTGTWKRLRGNDAGVKNPSGLERVRD